MGRLVRVRIGQWTKTEDGVWSFKGNPGESEQYVIARTNEKFDSVVSLIREELFITAHTPVILTYCLPECMLQPDAAASPPLNIATSHDVEAMMSVHEWPNELEICVSYGPIKVAKYQFLCRTPFSIGNKSFLCSGETE